jgi:hypothetical protein
VLVFCPVLARIKSIWTAVYCDQAGFFTVFYAVFGLKKLLIWQKVLDKPDREGYNHHRYSSRRRQESEEKLIVILFSA